MYICQCLAVTDRRICAAIAEGAHDEDSVARTCGAGSVCGGCRPAIRCLLAEQGLCPLDPQEAREATRPAAATGSSLLRPA